MSKSRKELTSKQYDSLRTAIDDLIEPFRESSPDLHIAAIEAIIDAVVCETCDMFCAEHAPEFISDAVNSYLKFERRQQDRDEQA